ncbi:hypothetical protein MMC25_000131 [Agyrium rufum]|nr:hypothetical protein [Agyrium rufum]
MSSVRQSAGAPDTDLAQAFKDLAKRVSPLLLRILACSESCLEICFLTQVNGRAETTASTLERQLDGLEKKIDALLNSVENPEAQKVEAQQPKTHSEDAEKSPDVSSK